MAASEIAVDWTLRLGDLATVGSIVVGGLLVAFEMRSNLLRQGERLGLVESELKRQTEILTALSAGEVRMDGIEKRLELLERK
jgi:hypothetical protein